MISKREGNKIDKEKRLREAAYALFMTQGIQNTSVSDIVKKADIAKGTFYLYFTDKSQLEEQLIVSETSKIMEAAFQVAENSGAKGFEDQFLIGVDYIIDYLVENEAIMQFIQKNLSYALYVINKDQGEDNRIVSIYRQLYAQYKGKVAYVTITEPEIVVSLCIELLGATIYSSLTFNKPKPMHEMRPHLHRIIRSIFQEYRI